MQGLALPMVAGATVPSDSALAAVFMLLGSLALGYLFGSIPFGLLLTKAAGLGDIRNIGSGNIGATNVLRTGNKGLAVATLLLDALKATVAVLVCHWLLKRSWQFPVDYMIGTEPSLAIAGYSVAHMAYILAAMAGFGAFLGHLYPLWLGFKGGKGVATYIGAALGIYWPAAVMYCGIWILTALLARTSSLAALTACALAPVYPLIVGDWYVGGLLLIMSIFVFMKHGANIERLRAGTEPKIGAKG
jgi:acyl phosphate:glycerol-3-phosphate acyltransferase